MPADCYFFVKMDEQIPDDQRTISTICVPCQREHYPGTGWFWKGSTAGYGPWNYICCCCGKDVSKGDECEN
jgi:hypothetical protein